MGKLDKSGGGAWVKTEACTSLIIILTHSISEATLEMMACWADIERLNFCKIKTKAGSLKSANVSSLTSTPILSTSSLLSLSGLTRDGSDSESLMALAEASARLSNAFLLSEFALSQVYVLGEALGEAGQVDDS